jgi:long-chain acyl-CoA synthetase|tara:strand:+ start:1784 stop:3490 length:1707 start_codon:yes stop_codon:yes gene_type:complete
MSEISIQQAQDLLTDPGSPFEIETKSIRGIEIPTWKNAASSLRELFLASRAFGDRTYLVYEDDRMSYEAHFFAAARLARILVDDYGVQKGDRVAIAMRNYPEWPVCFWAASLSGAVVVPLNAWWTASELSYGLKDSGSTILFADGERILSLQDHFTDLGLSKIIAIRGTGELPAGVEDYQDVIGSPDDDRLPDVDLDPEDDATIFYTSGTTGNPKGALGTHRNICTNLVSLMYGATLTLLRKGEELPDPDTPREPLAPLLSVPFFHATGCHSTLVANTMAGNKLVMMHRWNPERALELIEREKITSFGGVPSMVWQILESPDLATRDTSSIAAVSYGGAPAAPELVSRINEHFPLATPGNGYGLTETSSVTTLNSGLDYIRKPASVGRPVPVCQVKLMDDQGQPTKSGEIGELWIKGPNVVKGYWNKPEATASSFQEGWLLSGDLARIDEEGFVYIVDRAKDMLIRGGENIYCVEVENALFKHPDVMDAAVVGIPDKILGEQVGAVVQLTQDSDANEEALRIFMQQDLATFKVPLRIQTLAEPLPRNANGKILKARVKKDFLAYLESN